MERSSIRVLIVDDSVPWRRYVSLALLTNPVLQIIGEVSDGDEAVRKAQELQPDLVLIDIGLPKLNGMTAAQEILRLAPQSKILFVTQESAADVIQAALAAGAKGYVVKTHAVKELLPAVSAVLRGEIFISHSDPAPEPK